MKKTLAFLMIFLIMLSLSACKKGIDEQTAAPSDINAEVSDSENSADNQKEEIKQDSAESEKTEISEDEVKGDKAPPCDLTLENTFTEYEVIVTLTKEETAKQKEYTAKDFEEYGIFYLNENNEYYSNQYMKDSYPEYQDKTTLFMYINEPSKENVLKTVKELEKDERVFAACPNPLEPVFSVTLTLTEEYSDYLKSLAPKHLYLRLKNKDPFVTVDDAFSDYMETFSAKFKEDFFFDNSCSLNVYGYDENGYRNVSLTQVTEIRVSMYTDKLYTALKEYSNNPKVKNVVLKYKSAKATGDIYFRFNNLNYNSTNSYTKEMLQKYTDMKIIDISQNNDVFFNKEKQEVSVQLKFEKPTYQKIADMLEELKKDPKVNYADFVFDGILALLN